MTVHPESAGFDPVPETALSLQTGLTDIIAHRDAALAEMTKAAAALDAAYDLAEAAATTAHKACHGKTYYGNDRTESAHYDALFRGRFDPAISLDVFRKHLDASVWTHLLEATRMRDLMDVTDREAFDRDLMGEVPEVTFETVTATFNRLRQDADLIFKRGLAKAFSKLDRRFKSHDGFKIGSRIILTHVFDDWGSWNYHGRARDTIVDVERVFAILDNHNPDPWSVISAIERSRGNGLSPRQSDCEASYFRIKGLTP